MILIVCEGILTDQKLHYDSELQAKNNNRVKQAELHGAE